MKRYSTSIDFKFWTPKRATSNLAALFFLFFLLSTQIYAADEIRFSSNERTIINSVTNQFKRECGHVTILDESKLKEIQDYFQSNKTQMAEELKACYGEFLSQLVAIHNIHRQTCDEITPKKDFGKDKDLARIFVNVRKYQNGIRTYHEKLNECLTRKGANPKQIIGTTDFEKNGRILSQKIRNIDVQMPFKESSVSYR
jgi:hypothetical protein